MDKDTSGVFIIAKNRETAQQLTALFRLRKVHKTYLAICHGELEKILVNGIKNFCDTITKKIVEKSKTIFKVIDKNFNSSLVIMNPITAENTN